MKRSLMPRTSKCPGYEFKEVFNIDIIGFEEFARSFDEEIVVVCVYVESLCRGGDSCNARTRDIV